MLVHDRKGIGEYKMSEDSLKIEFNSQDLQDPGCREELEETYRKNIPESDSSGESSVETLGNTAIFYSACYSVDVENLSSVLTELEKKGAKDLIATVWYDTVGENIYYIAKRGELLAFNSREEINCYLKGTETGGSNIAVNYGKESRENTALIRIHVKAKGKRNKLLDLFRSAIDCSDSARFEREFALSIKSDSHDIEWCKFRWKGDESWNEVCSANLSNCITDVIEVDEYLVLAFDLEKAPDSSAIELDEFIWFIFIALDGVKKVWVKYRPIGCLEQYLHYPGMGDESYFVEKDVPDDDSWPKL